MWQRHKMRTGLWSLQANLTRVFSILDKQFVKLCFSGFDKCVVVTRFGVVSLQDFWLAPGLASPWNWALGAHGRGGWAG